ncbi:MAG: helix-turn-helix domain-containing protein [Pseudonocardiaceae bacterium]
MTTAKAITGRQMYDSKSYTVEQIAETIGVSRATVYRHLNPAQTAPLRVPSAVGDHERMGEYLATVTYAPELPAGWPLDEHRLPVVDPHPDEDPDRLL